MISLEYPRSLRLIDWEDYGMVETITTGEISSNFDKFIIRKYNDYGVINIFPDTKITQSGREEVIFMLEFDSEENKTLFILKYL